jgi:predicted nucleic acid-binding protein
VILVIDASMVIAALVDSGANGRWAEALLTSDSLAAPHLMPAEAANILRRSAAAGVISAEQASFAHADLLDLRVELFPYAPFAGRVWELRENVTCYDAWYVAIAEDINAPLATLAARLANTPGPRCQFVVSGAPKPLPYSPPPSTGSLSKGTSAGRS